jgi:hypothetical protein
MSNFEQQGMTALAYAREQRHADIVNMLSETLYVVNGFRNMPRFTQK